jgi:acetyl-CoA synthetase
MKLESSSRGGAPVDEPMWVPDDETTRRSNIYSVIERRSFNSYSELYQWSVNEPALFWSLVLEELDIRFERRPREVLDLGSGPTAAEWLPGARLNIVESCFRLTDEARPAIAHRGRETELRTVSYGELRRQANQVANGLRRLQLAPGDAVALCMPMTARAVAIYLGTILAGCVVVSIADSFSAEQVRLRLGVGNAKAVFTAGFVERGGERIPLYDRVREAADMPVVLADEELAASIELRPDDMLWGDFVGDESFHDVVHCDPGAAINVLFSSGTTAEPKAIPWDHVTPIKSAADGFFHQDIHVGNVVAWPTNFGWMMGPWLTFATLINRGTIALYEDQLLDRSFGEFVEAARVQILGVVPSMVGRWRRTACMEGLDWSHLRLFTSTGECSNPDEMRYLSRLAGRKPVIEYCGGTEIGGGYITSTVVQPNVPSAFSTPALGNALVILDEDGQPTNNGELFLIPPALGLSRRLVNGDHTAVYYEGTPRGPRGEVLRRHGDRMEELANGYYRALGRADDTLNVSGIKVGAAEIERVLSKVAGVVEVAVIGVSEQRGGPTRLVACVAMEAARNWDKQELVAKMQSAISAELNPLFRLVDVWLVDRLPRTASNKVMRRELRKSYDAERMNEPLP